MSESGASGLSTGVLSVAPSATQLEAALALAAAAIVIALAAVQQQGHEDGKAAQHKTTTKGFFNVQVHRVLLYSLGSHAQCVRLDS